MHHYIRIALRNQAKNKIFSIINVFGLSIGIAIAVIIINYVNFEFSYDNMHNDSERVYRVESQFYEGDVLTDDWATSSFGYGSAMEKEMTGIEEVVRIGIHRPEQTVSYKANRNLESGIAYAGSSFFSVFNFNIINGNKNNQLSKPGTCVITQEMAALYFKSENPIGKILTFAFGSNFNDYEVTGVMENFPQNSHIKYNFLISYASLPNWQKDFWYIHEVYTYIKLAPHVNPKIIESQFPDMAEKYKTNDALKNKKWAISLVPLKSIHFNPQKQYERELKKNPKSLSTLIVIAIVILLIAWINYINLATARSMEKAKDIGIRKASGAFKSQLTIQYLTESSIVNVLAFILATLLVFILHPVFQKMIQKDIEIQLIYSSTFWLISAGCLILGTLISGFYSSFILTKLKPSVVLKGNFSNTGSSNLIRRALVVFQFAAAIFLICGTFIVYKQVKFMQTQDIGVNINKTVVIKYPVTRNNLQKQVQLFANKLEHESNIKSVSLSGSVPGMEVAFFASNRLQKDMTNTHRLYEMLTVDDHFIETFDFEILSGRSFKEGFGNDIDNILINESALSSLGFKKPDQAIGEKVMIEGQSNPVNIIGVVKNWHQRGLANAYTPIMFLSNGKIGWISPKFIAIKISGENVSSAIKTVQKLWDNYFPEASFNYFFLDQFYNQQYNSEKQFGKIVTIFTTLAFLISILGLWALAAFTALKKVKEMGVRKVLGANPLNILYLFSKEIVALIMIAFLIATPISILVMNRWLENFAFRIDINVSIYIWGTLITILVALITVCWQSFKTATRNPVEALKYE